MIAKKQAHVHVFDDAHQKVVPVRRIVTEGGATKRDIITARDTIYYRKCKGERCKATQAFHLKREVV